MNILFISSEMSPLAKTGGLGDVVASLPAALKQQGHSVSVVIPFYRDVRQRLSRLEPTHLRIPITMEQESREAVVFTGLSRGGVRVYAIGENHYFDRPSIYGEPYDYPDNAERFVFFCRAAVELAAWLDPLPEVLHCNDWQTALIPGLVRARGYPYRTVFTIHNLAYQGIFPPKTFALTGLPGIYYSPGAYEHFGAFNLMKGALLLADEISTVSRGYADEIQTGPFGCGFDGLLRDRAGHLTGIVNGIDDEVWDPQSDPHIPIRYDEEHLHLKDANKQALQRECGMESHTGLPVFGCVSRLVGQKGLDVLAAATPGLVQMGGRLILLGSGDSHLEEAFTRLARAFPDRVFVEIGFDEGLAHRIEAGSDFFIMPSRFEPCGLNQMYSQRYGTIPLVHAVGGLRDTVQPWQVSKNGFFRGQGTGFFMDHLDTEPLLTTCREAMDVRRFAPFWKQIRANAMKQDFSWASVIPQYETLYRKVIRS